jgi:hypothetical protein
MTPIPRFMPLLSSALLVAALAGCAAMSPKSGEHDHSTTPAMDAQSHCEMHGKMMAGKSSAERHAMMQEHMKSMSPEMRQRMHAMHEQCK